MMGLACPIWASCRVQRSLTEKIHVVIKYVMAHIPHICEFSSQLWYAAGQFQYLKVDSIEIRITNESVKIYFWYLKVSKLDIQWTWLKSVMRKANSLVFRKIMFNHCKNHFLLENTSNESTEMYFCF